MNLSPNAILNRLYRPEWRTRVLGKPPFAGHAELSRSDYNNYAELVKLLFILRTLNQACEESKIGRENFRVLDVGTRTGNISIPLASAGYNVTGIDLDRDALNEARRRGADLTARFELRRAEDLADDAYDAIIACDLVEHLTDPNAFLSLCASRMRPTGIAVFSVPNGYGALEICVIAPARFIRSIIGRPAPEGYDHLQRFTIEKLKEMFGRHLSIEHVEPLGILFSGLPILCRSKLGLADLIASRRAPLARANRWLVVCRRRPGTEF